MQMLQVMRMLQVKKLLLEMVMVMPFESEICKIKEQL